MSRQRKNKQQSNPFKTLKGFCVSPAPKPPEPEPAQALETPVSPAAEDELFRREMSRLRVKGKSIGKEPPAASVEEEAMTGKETSPADEREVFLTAIGKLEKAFMDEVPEQEQAQSSTPRRMKLLRAGKLVPEAELDLHGLDRDKAREKTRHFLDDSVYQGKKTVLLITGKGHGSAGEPVLRGEMERFLAREAGAWVSEWGKAPRRYGGEGALVVFLRGKRQGKGK